MPMLRIQTSRAPDKPEEMIATASETVAGLLGKPEQYVMVSLEVNENMMFAGSADPLAYLELKSIGLPADETPRFSRTLCDLVHQFAGIDPARVYIEFADAPRELWGWNNATF